MDLLSSSLMRRGESVSNYRDQLSSIVCALIKLQNGDSADEACKGHKKTFIENLFTQYFTLGLSSDFENSMIDRPPVSFDNELT